MSWAGALDRALLIARTVRHLRPSQFFYWPLRRLQRLLIPSLPAVAEPITRTRRDQLAQTIVAWGAGDAEARIRHAEEILDDTFRFLNHTERLAAIDWRRRYVGHLWSYHLHYFDYALDLAWAGRLTEDTRFARRFEALAESWMTGSRPGEGDGWESYPLSVRAVNWTYALLLLGDRLAVGFRARAAESLFTQLAFLERRLERHLRANHLQKNLQALTLGGLLFEGSRAARWRSHAAAELWEQLEEQVLSDGGHFERSPMYHAIALADFLETAALLRSAGEVWPAPAVDRLRRMVIALGLLGRPDGSLHLFNDAANGIAPGRDYLKSLAALVLSQEIPVVRGASALPDTGYFGFANPVSGDRFLIDCGAPGPSYQPAHAHCDLLSFELDLGGRPVVSDSGVSGYEGDPLREYVRSTRAHNTVMIGGREQSEVWGTFRVGRRAEVIGAEQAAVGAGYRFTGAYRPYHDAHAVHRRTVEKTQEGWCVTDEVEGAVGQVLESFLHVRPDFTLRADAGRIILRAGDIEILVEPFGVDGFVIRRGEMGRTQGWYCPEFGKALPASTIEMRVERNESRPFGYRLGRLVAGS
jgi:heparinase II/III-like protein